jgi:heme/copper-type cytochrome/quinol oxidase subunit 2
MTPVPTPSIFTPVSTPAFAIRDLSFVVLAITGAIFVIVAGFAVYTLIRFGRRPTNPDLEPAQVYKWLEAAADRAGRVRVQPDSP